MGNHDGHRVFKSWFYLDEFASVDYSWWPLELRLNRFISGTDQMLNPICL